MTVEQSLGRVSNCEMLAAVGMVIAFDMSGAGAV